jgi:hypothetical protein
MLSLAHVKFLRLSSSATKVLIEFIGTASVPCVGSRPGPTFECVFGRWTSLRPIPPNSGILISEILNSLKRP